MIYDDQISSFQELLSKDNSFTVHHFNVQSLAIEMFKVINNIPATIIDDLFTIDDLFIYLCVQFITVKIVYSIMVPLSGI